MIEYIGRPKNIGRPPKKPRRTSRKRGFARLEIVLRLDGAEYRTWIDQVPREASKLHFMRGMAVGCSDHIRHQELPAIEKFLRERDRQPVPGGAGKE